MPAHVSVEQLVIVEQALGTFPKGATVVQLAAAMQPPPTERTLQRWLLILAQRRRISREGRGRATRYCALHPPRPKPAPAAALVSPPSVNAPVASARAPDVTVAVPAGVTADMTEQIFAAAIGDIVRYTMRPHSAVTYLQRLVERNIAGIDERRASFTVLKARLDAFTADDAERYGLERDQYERWRQTNAERERAASASADAAQPVPTEPVATPPTPVAAPPSVDRRHAPAPRTVAHRERVVTPDAARTPAEIPVSNPAPTAQPAGDAAEGDLGMRRTMTDLKRLVTPKRLAVTAVWTSAVSVTVSHVVGGPAASLITVPMAGLPALIYVDRDRKAANDPLQPGQMVTTLLAGGTAGTACAAPVNMLFESVLNLFR